MKRILQVCGVVALLAILSISAARWCFERGIRLYYGDAEAHLNIARRILDSRTPGRGADRHGVAAAAAPPDDLPSCMHDAWWRSGAGRRDSFGGVLRSGGRVSVRRRAARVRIGCGGAGRGAAVRAESEHAVSAIDADDGAAVRGVAGGAAVGDAVVSRFAIDCRGASPRRSRRTRRRSRATKGGS